MEACAGSRDTKAVSVRMFATLLRTGPVRYYSYEYVRKLYFSNLLEIYSELEISDRIRLWETSLVPRLLKQRYVGFEPIRCSGSHHVYHGVWGMDACGNGAIRRCNFRPDRQGQAREENRGRGANHFNSIRIDGRRGFCLQANVNYFQKCRVSRSNRCAMPRDGPCSRRATSIGTDSNEAERC